MHEGPPGGTHGWGWIPGARVKREEQRLHTGPPVSIPAVVLVTSGVLAAGCEAPPEEPAPLEGAPLGIDEPAVLDLGTVDAGGMEDFHDLGAPSLRPDGTLLVPVTGAGEIRVFDADGGFIASHGGIGSGPGEFQALRAVWPRGDTIEAWDRSQRRITRFTPDGEVTTVSLRPGDAADSPGPSSFLGALPDGWLFAAVTSAGWGTRDRIAVRRFGADGAHVGEEFAVTRGMERGHFGNSSGPLPLSPAAKFAFHRANEELYAAQTLAPSIEVFGASGEGKGTITWSPDRSWDPDEAFSRAARVMEEGREEPFRQAVAIPYPENWHRTIPPPDEVPAFSDFLVDEEGFLWVRPYVPERDAVPLGGDVGIGRSGPGGPWTILSPEGTEVGSLDTPDGLEPYQITSDRIVGIHRDELGVESVRVYPLRRH